MDASKVPHENDVRKDMRRMRLRFLLLGAAIVIVLGLSAIWLAVHQSSDAPLPELLQGLPQDWAEADIVFGVRVLNRFPTGMPLQDVVRELENQGFEVSADGKSAGFAQGDIVCSRLWRIFWATDEAQNIRGISGGYQGSVCL
jgi:hypothetical protein